MIITATKTFRCTRCGRPIRAGAEYNYCERTGQRVCMEPAACAAESYRLLGRLFEDLKNNN